MYRVQRVGLQTDKQMNLYLAVIWNVKRQLGLQRNLQGLYLRARKSSWARGGYLHMGDCQNYGPFLGPYYKTEPNMGPNLGDPKKGP